jgi:hypothetical protein
MSSIIPAGMDMPQPNYPQFLQCIGIIVGLNGIGAPIAAFHPVRYWPIVLAGFLVKVFGPVGMVQALWSRQSPWSFALNCVTNALIWWVLFFLILKHAWANFREILRVMYCRRNQRFDSKRKPMRAPASPNSLRNIPRCLFSRIIPAAHFAARSLQIFQWAQSALRKLELNSFWFTWQPRSLLRPPRQSTHWARLPQFRILRADFTEDWDYVVAI